MSALDLDDIQADVPVVYRASRSLSVFYRFPELALAAPRRTSPAGRALRRLAECVTRADRADRTDHSIVAGVSGAGLRALGVGAETMATLPAAFVDGMGARAHLLGDVLAEWELAFRDRPPHLLVLVRTKGADLPDSVVRLLAELAQELEFVYEQRGANLGRNGEPSGQVDNVYEHFGFKDGISNPILEGSPLSFTAGNGVLELPPGKAARWRRIRPGEFLLGYPDEMNEIVTGPKNVHLLRNGTYLVWRKLRQHVTEFRDHVREQDGGDSRAERLVGRTRDGAVLAAPGTEPSLNGFTFEERGLDSCPVTSHIRRMNPRAGIDLADEVVHRHRIIRRSMPYTDRDDQKGLLFLCYQADIARQFEFVQRQWLNSGHLLRLGDAPDEFADHTRRASRAGATSANGRDLPSFVTSLGGEYFLVPGVRALGQLARTAGTS